MQVKKQRHTSIFVYLIYPSINLMLLIFINLFVKSIKICISLKHVKCQILYLSILHVFKKYKFQ